MQDLEGKQMRAITGKYKQGVYTVQLPAREPEKVIKMKGGLVLRRLTSEEIDQARQGMVVTFSKN